MQKYYITDGNLYVRQTKGKFITVNSHVMATEFSKREGERILRFNLGKSYSDFVLEGVDDFKRIPKDEIVLDTVGDQEVVIQTENNTALESELSSLESYVDIIIKTEPFDCGELDRIRAEIESSISYYDLCLSDIYHWIMDNKPPAHIMTKIYCILKDTLQKRRRVKEDLGFVTVLIDADKSGQSNSETKKKLLNKVYDPYIPRTQIWRELESLSGNKEAIR